MSEGDYGAARLFGAPGKQAGAVRDELREHLKTFHAMLEDKADNFKTYGALWLTDPEKYGTTEEGAKEWQARGRGMKLAADLLKQRFNL